MKSSIILEQKIAVVALFILLALCVKFKSESDAVASNQNIINTNIVSDITSFKADEPSVSVPSSNVSQASEMSQEFPIPEYLKYEEVQKWVDTRNGDFKSARFLPQHRSVRYFENGKLAVVNSLVEIRYGNMQEESVNTFRKIDVFVKENGSWSKPRVGEMKNLNHITFERN